MKNAALFLVLACVVCGPAAQAFENEPTGFRGVTWGTPIEQAHGIYLHDHAIGDRVSYRRSFEDLSVNGIPLQAVFFDFYRGRFEEAVLMSRYELRDTLLQTFAARYGTPSQVKGHRNEYFWSGKTATIVLRCSGRRVTCSTVIASNAMLAEEQAGQTNSARGIPDKDF